MPGKVKVKIISGKNLPVMDRSSDTTDAYVEIKLGNTTYKTDVCRRTLHPQWNTDWYRFEVDDSELQDEPLQIRLMDHDTYSANDAIGKVYLNLNPLLLPVAGQLAIGDNNPHHEISGWIPVYDTMHGIRGEVNVTVKVELFSDFNRFRQSSCGVHFFYSPTIPQGYHAKVINGFVEELIVDDDPEYQWIDKIRTPRASNEARQTLFFKLSGELQRKIGVKALGLGGNAVIGYRQCFDIEGESGIVARGIGTAVTLMKAYNTSNVVPEVKDENVESYLKFVGNGKSFSLCSTAPSHIPFSLFCPFSNLNNSQPCVSQLTKSHYASLQSNEMSVSNPNLYQRHNIKELLDQEEKRGKSVMSRRFKKFRHSQKSLSKKMIALKAKLNDSIGEETDDMQARNIDKRKLFKRTASDSSAMAEILARSVMRATTSLSCILEDQPHLPNENESMGKVEPEANLLNRSESEASGFVEVASDAQSCSSSDSSSSCSYYEYKDFTNANNDVETLSNIITNVEKLQRCLSRDGLHKQYSLPSIPTRGFSLSSLDSFSQLDRSDHLRRNSSQNRSTHSIFSMVSNCGNSDSKFVNQKRRSSDVCDSTLTEANIYSHGQQISAKFDEINLSAELIGKSSDNSQNFLENSTEILSPKVQSEEFASSDAVSRVPNIKGNDNLSGRKQEEWKFPPNKRFQHQNVENSFCQLKQHSPVVNLESSSSTVNTSLASIPANENMAGTSKSGIESGFEFPCIKNAHCKHNFASDKYNQSVEHIETDSQGIVKTALQTMLIERADLLGTDSLNTTSDVIAKVSHADKANSKTFHQLGGKEIHPKGIVKTALQTMLIERADILGTPEITELQTEQSDQEKCVHRTTSGHDKDVDTKGIVNTALQTMLIERANMLSSAPDNTLQTGAADVNEKHLDLGDESSGLGRHIEHSDDIRTIAEVTLDSVNIQPKKMVRTAMQTMLLDKFNILGTYTPPSSPNLMNDEPNSSRSRAFTFNMGEYVRKSIPKSYSSISLGDQHKQKETVLGMPFVSLSSLKSDNDKFAIQPTTVLAQDGLLQKSVSEKLNPHKKMFRFLSLKANEHHQNSNIFPRLRTKSKQSILDDSKSDVIHENVLSRMFHSRFHEKPINDKETQTSIEVLFCEKPVKNSDVSSSPNNASVTDTLIPPLKPPSSVDLASGDFIAHSKTKSACITSHHSSPAQERQDQNGGDKKEHIPDAAVRTSQSPVKVNYMVPLHRRSSDSDLSITPKGNSLTGSDKSMGNAAAYFMRNNYFRRGQVNPEHFDLLEYPFLTMTKFPPRFIIQIGGSISARSVKLLERILNVDEPESRDIWWSEIRMEIRSHARSLNCNAVLGYTELTSICDDVCVLSACGTAAVIDFNSSAGDEDNFSNVQLIHKNVERDKQANGQSKTLHDSPDHRVHSAHYCAVTHLPYDEKTVPVKAKITKCPVCLKAKVPEVIIATIEPPESVPTVGKGCFIESHVSRALKDLRGEAIAKEISDGLPFLEYELHRLLVNKLKIKGMNAIFSLKIRITVGEKLLVGVATGTAVYSSCLPTPDLPVLVTGKVSDEKVVADLQEMLSQTVKKNKEIYQIKDDNQAQKALSDEDSDTEQAPLDISCGNKDCCILEMDDPEDAEVLRLLMQEKIPDGIHVVSTESVPGLEDLEIVKNLQMFTQIYRAKLPPPYDLQKHFVRLLQSIYFKLRRMVPCALCDLQFRIDIPEPDEIQLCVIGMALGLGKKSKKGKSIIAPTKPEDDLIFKLDDYHAQDPTQPSTSKASQVNQKYRNNRSPSKYRPQSLKQRHIPFNERHGVDITPLSYVPGGTIEQYLGNINFFFIRETTSIREEGGLSGFIHSFVTEVLAIVRSHVTALGGNALVAFFMTECVLNHNLHKNQGQCLINVGGDVVSVAYFKDEA